MPRTTSAALPLLAALALLPAEAAAGPPVGPSGRTALDPIEDGLRQLRAARTPEARRRWVKRLAKTHDPRVAVALGEALGDESPVVSRRAAIELAWEYMPGPRDARSADRRLAEVDGWWKENEADLRRRAAQQPR
jgi:hypothetical protein